MKKSNLQRNFMGVNLMDVDTNKLPVSLACITDDIIKTENGSNLDTGHLYHSDEPRYDHTRDD